MVAETRFLGGRYAVRGAELAVQEINAGEGIVIAGRKHRIELIVVETDSTPEATSRAALELINQQQIHALVGPSRSLNAIPVAQAVENAGIPMIAPGSSHPATTAGRRYAFRGVFLDPDQAQALARFALEYLNARTGALLYDDANDYNRGLAGHFRHAFEALGGQVIAEETYITGETDFQPALSRIADRRPDLLLLPNFSRDVMLQVRQIRQLGLSLPILGTDSWDPNAMPLDQDFEGVYFSQSWHLETTLGRAAGRHFVTIYRKRYREDPQGTAALSYDTIHWLAQAASEAGTTEPAAIREALDQLEAPGGATGPLSYRGRDGDPRRPVLILEVRGGALLLARQMVPPPDPMITGEPAREDGP